MSKFTIKENWPDNVLQKFMTYEFAIVDYLFFKLSSITKYSLQKTNRLPKITYELSEKLINYHKDYSKYLHDVSVHYSTYNSLHTQFKQPQYKDYVNIITPEPDKKYIDNAIYEMLEGGYVGWEKHFFVARHNIQKINYLLFKTGYLYILVYVKNGKIYDFRIINL